LGRSVRRRDALVSDIRQIGSGNIGATNVRARRGPGAALHLTARKRGALISIVSREEMALAAGIGAMVDIFPVWLVQGGKGVATALASPRRRG
jgi:glycerol-3-phosphate acyltransferase PlsY